MSGASPRLIPRVRRTVKLLGWREAAAMYSGHAVGAVATRTPLRRYVSPGIGTLSSVGAMGQSAAHVAEELGLGGPLDVAPVAREYADLADELSRRYGRQTGLSYPPVWAVGTQLSQLLYIGARLLRPRLALETGVANGHSTFFLLHALRANGIGELISTDVGDDVASLLTHEEKRDWTFVRLNKYSTRREFGALVSGLTSPVDLFTHDSQHRYSWQTFEYTAVMRKLRTGGVFASDDVDVNFAFVDFCKRFHVMPRFLLDWPKVIGVFRNGGPQGLQTSTGHESS